MLDGVILLISADAFYSGLPLMTNHVVLMLQLRAMAESTKGLSGMVLTTFILSDSKMVRSSFLNSTYWR